MSLTSSSIGHNIADKKSRLYISVVLLRSFLLRYPGYIKFQAECKSAIDLSRCWLYTVLSQRLLAISCGSGITEHENPQQASATVRNSGI
jgi:hypothetical protein